MSLIDNEQKATLERFFLQIIERNLTEEAMQWLKTKVSLIKAEDKSLQLNLCFSHLPRFAGKKIIELSETELDEIMDLSHGFTVENWTIDRLCRVWLLMQIPDQDKDQYLKKINGLFAAAEMNEQIALYSALPFYTYPEEWISRTEDGIRSNIGSVLEAIMYYNPYPAKYLSENAWNQLVLKAFFTEKNVDYIIGLQSRSNEKLIETLNDYVQERLAAHRTVNPEIYELIEQQNQKI